MNALVNALVSNKHYILIIFHHLMVLITRLRPAYRVCLHAWRFTCLLPIHNLRANGPSNRHQGFTLVEILAAFLVFTLVLTVILQLTTASLRNVGRASGYTEAAFWAESKLAEVKTRRQFEVGVESGDFNERYRWELEISPYESQWPSIPTEEVAEELSEEDDAVEPHFDLIQLKLLVLWDNDKYQESFVTLASRFSED